MKTLLHICCAPCSVACVDTLRHEGIRFDGFWFNPNIQPFTEYTARRDTLINFASDNFKLILDDDYNLKSFAKNTAPDYTGRCGYCYDLRLQRTAKYAKENGYDSFTSTLFISPYQDHDLMIKSAMRASQMYEVEFLYRDFRPYFRQGQTQARELGMYMQKYCGCVFSEEERYQKKIDKLKGITII